MKQAVFLFLKGLTLDVQACNAELMQCVTHVL